MTEDIVTKIAREASEQGLSATCAILARVGASGSYAFIARAAIRLTAEACAKISEEIPSKGIGTAQSWTGWNFAKSYITQAIRTTFLGGEHG